MRFIPTVPPREFQVGRGEPIRIKDCGRVHLEPDEQVTFVTQSGKEYDVARKAWGFYATPSLNGRLSGFDLRGVLVRSPIGKYYVFLVERGKESLFDRYLELERHVIVAWLDTDEALASWGRALHGAEPLTGADARRRCLCQGVDFTTVFDYTQPPAGEPRFQFIGQGGYRREILRCSSCGHFVASHSLDLAALYAGDYVTSNYGDLEGIQKRFEHINAMDPALSDNAGRVQRINQFARTHFGAGRTLSVLDIGSGLCVFLHRMKAAGWDCTALDPDPRSARHAELTVGVKAVCADFMKAEGVGTFDLVTLNKVLEHVGDPVSMLARVHRFMRPAGYVYVEVPDGEAAVREGSAREEFFVDHLHIFSAASLALLASRARFQVRVLERLREPSGKFTLRAFLVGLPEGRS